MTRSSPIVVLVLAGWFFIVLLAGRAGAFEAAAGQPPVPLLAAVVVPLLLFAAAYRLSSVVRRFSLALDLRVLTAMQAWRVIGIMFLALYAFGLLPGLFAWPAGVGDVAVGFAAPFVVWAMLRGAPTWRAQVAWLNIAGLVDFAGALGTGALASASLGAQARAPLGALPLSLVPTFAVPVWIILHLISLLQLRRAARGA